MTLLITVFAAIASTVVWYMTVQKADLKLGTLCFLYWGASVMWLVDAIFEFAELQAAYFTPSSEDMINDAFLGFAVVALGLIIWLVRLLLADPKGIIAERLLSKKERLQ